MSVTKLCLVRDGGLNVPEGVLLGPRSHESMAWVCPDQRGHLPAKGSQVPGR